MANRKLDTLIVVCGHAIWVGGESKGENEEEWLIEPFQSNETSTFIKHIEAGVRELSRRPGALLVFSGGATKRAKTDLTEAESYCNLAAAKDMFDLEGKSALLDRMFQDRYATDSYQNVLLSLIQFPLFAQQYRERIGTAAASPQCLQWPSHLVVVSHEFKRARFVDLHLTAFKWRRSTEFIGINPPFSAVKMAEIEDGDKKRGYGIWKDDIYGNGQILSEKRAARGYSLEHFREGVLSRFDKNTLDVLEGLLVHPGTKLFAKNLPWE